jgi:hypothetical protein
MRRHGGGFEPEHHDGHRRIVQAGGERGTRHVMKAGLANGDLARICRSAGAARGRSSRAGVAAGLDRGHARHFVNGDRGVSEWTFTGTHVEGTRVEVHGCDLFTFRDGKIALKNSYRKNRPTVGGRP